MKTWRVDGDPSAGVIDELAAVLNGGGVALFPTDTIYGLHAVATDEKGVSRIAAIKQRPADKRFVIIAASVDQLRTRGVAVPEVLSRIWPAALTAVLASGDTTVAARVPRLGWLRALLTLTGPLVSTSANRSGEAPITSPEMLGPNLQNLIDALLDQGPVNGKASTIVDFTGSEPKLIREGDQGFTQFLRKTLWKDL